MAIQKKLYLDQTGLSHFWDKVKEYLTTNYYSSTAGAAVSGKVDTVSGALGTLNTTVEGIDTLLSNVSGVANTNATNIASVSGSLSGTAATLNAVSGSVDTNASNISAVSGAAVTNATNIAAVSGSLSGTVSTLSAVSGAVGTNATNISTLSGSLNNVSGAVVTNATNISTLSGNLQVTAGQLSDVSAILEDVHVATSYSGTDLCLKLGNGPESRFIALNDYLTALPEVTSQHNGLMTPSMATQVGKIASISGDLVSTSNQVYSISGRVSDIESHGYLDKVETTKTSAQTTITYKIALPGCNVRNITSVLCAVNTTNAGLMTPTQKSALETATSNITAICGTMATKAPLASPALTGTPTAPTALKGTNTTQVATTAFVACAVGDAVSGLSEAIGELQGVEFVICNALPATGESRYIYLVPESGQDADTHNSYAEYIWVGNAFEKIGDTNIDLSTYTQDSDFGAITCATIDAMFA